jgi:hypothetical protein
VTTPIITANITYTGPGSSGGFLNLNSDDTGIYIDEAGWGIGVVAHTVQEAASPYVDGTIPTSIAKSNSKDTLKFQVIGDDYSDLSTKIATLIAAFQQWSYTVSIQWEASAGSNSDVYAWLCWKADYGVAFDRTFTFGQIAVVAFTLNRFPLPALGPV